MPSGIPTSEELKTEILRLRAQGLTYKVIALRTRLSQKTLGKIIKEKEKEEDK